jgi:hypothetical protein
MRRQRILYQPHPPRLWAVIDEAALWRPIGGPEVTRGQLRALHETARRENITVQVMPFRVGGHARPATHAETAASPGGRRPRPAARSTARSSAPRPRPNTSVFPAG